MVATPTPIHGLPQCDLSYADNPPADIDALASAVDKALPVWASGTPAVIPSGLVRGSTNGNLYMSDGTSEQVVSSMSEARQFLSYNPPSTADTGTSGTALWVAMGALTVPPWASRARCQLFINGAYALSAGTTSAHVQVQIGGTVSGDDVTVFYAASERSSFSMACQLTGLVSGSSGIHVNTVYVSGGAIRVDNACKFDLTVDFLP